METEIYFCDINLKGSFNPHFKLDNNMNIKGRYLPQNLIQNHQRKVSIKISQSLTSYLPFATELPDIAEVYSIFEMFLCLECAKEDSENCDCNAGFEKYKIKIGNGF